MKDRSKRKYGFGDLTAPTKLECLELVEKEKEVGYGGHKNNQASQGEIF